MVLEIALGIILAIVILCISREILSLILIFWVEVISGVIALAIIIPMFYMLHTNLESVKLFFGRFIAPLICLAVIAMIPFTLKEKSYSMTVSFLLSSVFFLYWVYDSWK